MNRLYIISDSIENGSSFAFQIGLSEGNFKVLTKYSDCEEIPNGVIYINDNHHPLEAVAINSELAIKNGVNLKDKEYLSSYLQNIIGQIQLCNSMFGEGTDVSVRMGVKKLQSLIESDGLTVENGFEFTYMYNLAGRYYYLVPQSDKSKVIINLIKWKIGDNQRNMSHKIEGIKINDPHGVLKNAGKIQDSGYFK